MLFRKKPEQLSLPFVAFIQAVLLVLYCSLVGLIMVSGDKWAGPITGFYGPMLFLLLFVSSALISSLIVLGYPFILFWEEKRTKDAITLVLYTTLWLFLFVFTTITILTIT